jgi:hypothetical protein
MSRKTYNVLKPREYTNSNGEVKKAFVEVGAAWDIENGGMSIELHEGIAVSGRFVILPRKERADDDGAAHE